MNIIMNHLLNSNEKVIHKSKIKLLLKDIVPSGDFEDTISNLRKSKRIKYLFKGHYYILNTAELQNNYYEYSVNEMVFVILNKLNVHWYIGLHSALEHNKRIWQAHNILTILNDKFSKDVRINGNQFKFRKIKKEYFFGKETKKTRNRITFYYSDVEKTIIDFAYFDMRRPLELTKDYNGKKMDKYLIKYPKLIKKRVIFNE